PSRGELRDFLLRRLPEARREKLEELYFGDDSLLDSVEQAEDELVSDYVLGRLSPADRRTFEESLLETPYYRERIETTTQMRLRIGRLRAFRKGPAPGARLLTGRAGLLAGFSLLLVLFVAALASALRLKSELESSSRALAAATGAPAGVLRALVLPPSGGPDAIRIARHGDAGLVLVLPRPVLPPAGRAFRVALRAGDRTVWESYPLPAGGPAEGDLPLRRPAGVPPPGQLEVILSAEGDAAAPRVLATLDVEPSGR
ncbi:MAG TPA: hypothetical protein PK598_16160, partial [Thermoanaerobaculia bacterium]|nr:hypothetical protein [Thermoanaerobaculia bacterium]